MVRLVCAPSAAPAGCSGNFTEVFIKAEAFVVLGLLQVSCPLTTFSSPQRLRDYDALHHKRYGLLIHYHALSLMCDRFGIFLFFVALHILRCATSTL